MIEIMLHMKCRLSRAMMRNQSGHEISWVQKTTDANGLPLNI